MEKIETIRLEFLARWRELCEKNYREQGDIGSCVLGAGVTLNNKMWVTAHSACRWQGSILWEIGLDELIEEFKTKYGLNLRHEYGNMD